MDDIELVVKSIDELRIDVRSDIKEIKKLIFDHIGCCDDKMGGHDKRIRKAEHFNSKIIGGLIVVGAIITLVVQWLLKNYTG